MRGRGKAPAWPGERLAVIPRGAVPSRRQGNAGRFPFQANLPRKSLASLGPNVTVIVWVSPPHQSVFCWCDHPWAGDSKFPDQYFLRPRS